MIVTDEEDCLTTEGKQCIIPFNVASNNGLRKYYACYQGKCATRLNNDGTAKEERTCNIGCPGSN